MNSGEYFKINSIEELKQAYYMFEVKWCHYLEFEIKMFNDGCRCVKCNYGVLYLGDYFLNGFTEIPSPLRNINNLNKLI